MRTTFHKTLASLAILGLLSLTACGGGGSSTGAGTGTGGSAAGTGTGSTGTGTVSTTAHTFAPQIKNDQTSTTKNVISASCVKDTTTGLTWGKYDQIVPESSYVIGDSSTSELSYVLGQLDSLLFYAWPQCGGGSGSSAHWRLPTTAELTALAQAYIALSPADKTKYFSNLVINSDDVLYWADAGTNTTDAPLVSFADGSTTTTRLSTNSFVGDVHRIIYVHD